MSSLKLLIFCMLFVSVSLPKVVAVNESVAKSLVTQLGLKESKIDSDKMKGWRQLKKVVLWGEQQDLPFYQNSFPTIEFVASRSISSVVKNLKNADAFIGFCIPELFETTVNVSWIQSMGVGVEGCVNANTIKNSNVILTNTQRLSAPEIAEHAIAMMFALVRRLDQYLESQKQSSWDRNVAQGAEKIWEINGRTILIVGLGGIGTETARRANALGMRVLATRNSSRNGPEFVSYVGLSDELLKLAAKADVVVNTVPLTKKTTGIFNRAFFRAMKKNAYFINIARGKSVVTDDLIAALNAGELAGAGLDVTDPEPLPKNHPLWKQPRVIITPHVAYRSEKLRQRVRTLTKENLSRYIKGEKLLSVVNIERGY